MQHSHDGGDDDDKKKKPNGEEEGGPATGDYNKDDDLGLTRAGDDESAEEQNL